MSLATINKKTTDEKLQGPRTRFWASRTLFLLCLVCSCGLLGWAARYFIRLSEQKLGRSQFKAIAERVLVGARETLLRRRSSAVTMSTIYGSLFPNQEDWPFVGLEQFDLISRHLGLTASGMNGENDFEQGLGVANFLTPDQVEDFNNYQRDYLDTYFPHIPARSVYKYPSSYTLPNGTVVQLMPLPTSEFNISAPVSRLYAPHTKGANVMLDLFSSHTFRPAIEYFLRVSSLNDTSTETWDCGVFSAPFSVPTDPLGVGPSSSYIHPIFPANPPKQVSYDSHSRV